MRKKIKENAKGALSLRYWPMVGLELLAGILVGGSSVISSSGGAGSSPVFNNMQNSPQMRLLIPVIISIVLVLGAAGILYTFLFGNLIRVGITKIRLSAYRRRSFRFADLFSGLRPYGRNVGTMALETLFITLGGLCFIVPGIIVAYGLFEVPYLLNEDPTLSGMAAIRRSWEDMRGHKGELFVLQLSFIGCFLLTALTFGILGIFYVGPYYEIANAGFYHELHAAKTTQEV